MTIVPTVFGMLKLAVRLEVPKYRIGVESLPKCDHAGIFDSSSGLGKKLAQLREGANKRLRPSHLGKPALRQCCGKMHLTQRRRAAKKYIRIESGET